jgi:two-component system nitrate/nitrite response regulator NarL
MIHVLIAANTRLQAEGLSQMLGRRSGLTVVGVKSNRKEIVADILGLKPDIVLLDIAMAESHAIVQDIKQFAPGVPVVALGVAGLEGDVLASVEAGIAGYVTREGSLKDLVAVVESAARGEFLCPPEIAGSLLRRVAALAADRESNPPKAKLTIRECEILRLIEQDLSNKEIARRLGVEVPTIKNHVHNLLEKLNVHRRGEAVRLYHHSPGWTRGTPGQPVKR